MDRTFDDPSGVVRLTGWQVACRLPMVFALSLAASCATPVPPPTVPGPTPLPTRSLQPSPPLGPSLQSRAEPTALSTPIARNAKAGFKGKDCAMVSPILPADLRKQAKPATVRARAYFVDGAVTKVTVLSGPRLYREPVIAAMKQYTCKGFLTFAADQTFVFAFPPNLPLATEARSSAS